MMPICLSCLLLLRLEAASWNLVAKMLLEVLRIECSVFGLFGLGIRSSPRLFSDALSLPTSSERLAGSTMAMVLDRCDEARIRSMISFGSASLIR
jgi:hypothetical protein